jgi:DNA modification methylase
MTSPLRMMQGDARNLDQTLEAASRQIEGLEPGTPFLTATITSPPYSDLVDYGAGNQIGHGQTEAEYLDDCRAVLAALFRWTKDDGVLWLVAESHLERGPKDTAVSRLNPLPFRLAALAESVGWTLREVVIWHKDRTRPWTHKGKFRKAFEHVLLLVKGPDYKFHADRLRESGDLTRWWVQYPERYNVLGKAPENVWKIPIPVQGSWGRKAYQHACPLPPELVRRLVLLSTDEDDIVCDPFGGIGTVPGVAEALKRRAIATEINPKFVKYYEENLREEVREQIEQARILDGDGPTPATIVSLRLLKYPKVAFSRLLKGDSNRVPSHIFVDVDRLESDGAGSHLGNAVWYFVLPDSTAQTRSETADELRAICSVSPLSKFQVTGEIRVLSTEEALEAFSDREWFVYEHGHTWNRSKEASGAEVMASATSLRRGAYPPIASNVSVSIALQTAGRMD